MANSKRILGVDLGTKRTGVAVTDPGGRLASGIELVLADNLSGFAKKIMELAEKYDVSEIVLGYPLNLNGTKGEAAQRADKFKLILEWLIAEKSQDITVTLFDERLTTSLAHVYLNQTGIKGKNRITKIDMLSAQIILQNYIDSKRENR
ncbi:MAG: Holliday junction resolvase RuvX [Oscillospiraceae bacterium]|nr:Holliday junction resolvase RuvX [Oscillospiraceae bacterium]MCL2159928.1 Holliday junction resolvase RuvX [Oscillospiraceae bacterium]